MTRPLVSRLAWLLSAVATVWCLGCDSYERIADAEAPAAVSTAASSAAVAPSPDAPTADGSDDCPCVQGHAAQFVLSLGPAAEDRPRFSQVEIPEALGRLRAAPPLRPPVA